MLPKSLCSPNHFVKLMTAANLITSYRFMVGVFLLSFGLYHTRPMITLLLVISAALSDFLDGLFARLYRQTSTLGRLLDPIADFMFILGLTFSLWQESLVTTSFLIAVGLRYMTCLCIFRSQLNTCQYRPLFSGKCFAACLMVTLSATLFNACYLINIDQTIASFWVLSWILLWLSWIDYTLRHLSQTLRLYTNQSLS